MRLEYALEVGTPWPQACAFLFLFLALTSCSSFNIKLNNTSSLIPLEFTPIVGKEKFDEIELTLYSWNGPLGLGQVDQSDVGIELEAAALGKGATAVGNIRMETALTAEDYFATQLFLGLVNRRSIIVTGDLYR